MSATLISLLSLSATFLLTAILFVFVRLVMKKCGPNFEDQFPAAFGLGFLCAALGLVPAAYGYFIIANTGSGDLLPAHIVFIYIQLHFAPFIGVLLHDALAPIFRSTKANTPL